MQTAQAFQQVTAALSWPVDNLQRVAEWRASVERVLLLEDGIRIVVAEDARSGPDAIVIERMPDVALSIASICVAAPDGTALLRDITLRVDPGECVLVNGDADAARALFRVLAGIWPWGQGVLHLPPRADIAAIGDRPHLPKGTLHAALAFPAPPSRYAPEEAAAALAAAGLPHLVPRLAQDSDWAEALGMAEIQRMAFARLLLHQPRWVLLCETTASLEPEEADDMLDLLEAALPETGVLVLGHHTGRGERFSRRLILHRLPNGEILLREIHARRQEARQPRPRPLPVVDWLRGGYGHRGTPPIRPGS